MSRINWKSVGKNVLMAVGCFVLAAAQVWIFVNYGLDAMLWYCMAIMIPVAIAGVVVAIYDYRNRKS